MGGTSLSCMSISGCVVMIGDRRPQLLAFELARDLKSVVAKLNGNGLAPSSPSNFGVGLVFPHLARSSRTFFFTRPRFLSNFEFVVSMLDALLLDDLPGLASGLIIHQELFPVPSFWTRTKRLCRDKLCRIEFCRGNQKAGKRFNDCMSIYMYTV